ncbi:TlpA disulfide reductase family protein [Actinoplanes sp. NEAU-A12]|uniref:TlpA disulfide reductase family protein n=1 Tax=Actinoplanes sandaracinus TaxID=3045177 RepID=A0ABT6WLR4_9ACTN|nr:TlpA disulfide reductase family protein [Actinoplanes sandaracinus]MDI6100678.1 TlpA disulfide reductase family protein [Actinoplanes sandaracinus]
MRRLAVAALAAVTTAAVLSGCGGEENWAKKCSTTNMVVECDAAHRPLISGVTGELLDGRAYDLEADRGKVVVVNFWGSWCSPCRAEADDLEKAYQATKAKDVTFLGINTRDERDSAKAFERAYQVTYASLYDFQGDVGLKFDVTQSAIPNTLVLDRQGRIAAAIRRSTTLGELQPLVEKIAAEAAG